VTTLYRAVPKNLTFILNQNGRFQNCVILDFAKDEVIINLVSWSHLIIVGTLWERWKSEC
jgi:hypothetical protein